MMQMQFGTRALVAAILVALLVGVVVGLFIGWIAWPVQVTNVDLVDLRGSAQDDYILLVAKAYAFEQDLDKAHERLALLNRPKIEDDVAALATTFHESDPEYAYLANLAIALGSTRVKIAEVIATPRATLTAIAPSGTPTLEPSPTLIETATGAPRTATLARTPTRTRAPTPRVTATTRPPTAQPNSGTIWIPSFPSEWPGGVSYQPASVAAGQKYWRLAQAIYCDIRETRFDCPNKPGGSDGIGVYVSLADGFAPLIVDGSPANLENKSADPQCQCTYELFPDGRSIQVGNFPSDKIAGLALSSVKTQIPQTHVRYFLTFQLVTR